MLGWGGDLVDWNWLGGAGWSGKGAGSITTVAQHAPARFRPILLSFYKTNTTKYYYTIILILYTTTPLYHYTPTTILYYMLLYYYTKLLTANKNQQ